MPYGAAITRANPSAFLFLLDQSASMGDAPPTGRPKAVQATDVLNRTLYNLILACTKNGELPRNYFDIGFIGYGQTVENILPGSESSTILRPLSEIAVAPLRIEERKRRVDDGAGGLVEQTVEFPVWLEPVHANGTPMCQALDRACTEIDCWISSPEHAQSFPPIVLHITDGESTDGDPTAAAKALTSLATADGNVLLFNLHFTGEASNPVLFPSTAAGLPNQFANLLFEISSPLTPYMVEQAQQDFKVDANARGYAFNADFATLVHFIDVGTRSKNSSELR